MEANVSGEYSVYRFWLPVPGVHPWTVNGWNGQLADDLTDFLIVCFQKLS